MKNYDGNKTEIFVDADACPVKDEILFFAKKYQIEVTFIASYNHVSNNKVGNWVYVDEGKEEADLYIMNHTKKGDIVITQDIGLASILVKQSVYTISPRGKEYLEKEMEATLHMRYLSAKERRKGIYTKGPKPFTDSDRKHFMQTFERILSNLAGIQ